LSLRDKIGSIIIILGIIVFPLGSLHVIFVINPSLDTVHEYAWECGVSVLVGFLLMLSGILVWEDDKQNRNQKISKSD
jgi:hypothetical protein